MRRRQFFLIGWFDLALGLWVAAGAGFEVGWGYWTILVYGVSLFVSGAFTRIAATVGHRLARVAWSIRAALYSLGACSAAYVLLMPIWSTEKTSREDFAFLLGGVAFLAANSGLSIWLYRRHGTTSPEGST